MPIPMLSVLEPGMPRARDISLARELDLDGDSDECPAEGNGVRDLSVGVGIGCLLNGTAFI